MKNNPILAPLPPEQQLWFIKELQRAFQKAVDETLSHTEEPVISQKEILSSMNCIGSKSYLILQEGNPVGGMVLNINKETHRNSLELFFLQPEIHGQWNWVSGLAGSRSLVSGYDNLGNPHALL